MVFFVLLGAWSRNQSGEMTMSVPTALCTLKQSTSKSRLVDKSVRWRSFFKAILLWFAAVVVVIILKSFEHIIG